MATRTIYLISARNTSFQRAHFSIFVPSATNPDRGTKIHAVGAPMAGYIPGVQAKLQSQSRTSRPDLSNRPDSLVRHRKIELAATQVPTPGVNQNFMAPVNDTTNKRCQEWTMEYVRHLVAKWLIDEEAIEIVQSKRDPPTHGIGLRSVTRSGT
ncbi:hypothetical protein N7530_003010 [Penicillium desertorum]|uniref:Uncharacterized protein n=1 Tax=Penicillium desertorum TaxID=1303715 RepID=A0A9W9X4M6_9EURO|nr:hypothetical protein N7530_003010 [Penicillium desertorum]